MRTFHLVVSVPVMLLFGVGCARTNWEKGTPPPAVERPLKRIAFGSCVRQDKPQPVWDAVLAQRADAFVFLGDNIYADLKGAGPMAEEYARLAASPGFAKLRETCPRVLATWDDHDYGLNDAGTEFPAKQESQRTFCDFWREPPDSPRRMREGVYDARVFGPPGKRVQVILLDTRYFRSPLGRKPTTRTSTQPLTGPATQPGPYMASGDRDATVLGEAQWAWLAQQLKVPAEVRLVCTSIQLVHDAHGWESWGNFPRERQRFLDLVRSTKANGVLLVSGDRHFSELSKIEANAADGVGYPLYDLTSSSLNQPRNPASRLRGEPNARRVGKPYDDSNFGLLTIDWEAKGGPVLTIESRDVDGLAVIEQRVALRELKVP